MTGADRFQFFIDKTSRSKTGTGNIIKAHIILRGHVDEETIRKRIRNNKAVNFLSGITQAKKWYSAKHKWRTNQSNNIESVLSFHTIDNPDTLISQLLLRDCSFQKREPIHIDIVYEGLHKTHFLLLVNHSLIDYTGMDLLLNSISSGEELLTFVKPPTIEKSFFKRFIETVSVTFFVAAQSGWDIQRLNKNEEESKAAHQTLTVQGHEWHTYNNTLPLFGLPHFLAASVKALSLQKSLIPDSKLSFFIPSPIDRRSPAYQKVLLSNYMSFLFFKAEEKDLVSTSHLRKLFTHQMIQQARKGIPEKFQSLMNIFSFLPAFIYEAFLNLPSKGHSSTFALSVLPKSLLEGGKFMGSIIEDYTHYPPIIPAPGLNIVFMEMKEGIKIIAGFDKSMISENEAGLFLKEIKHQLDCA